MRRRLWSRLAMRYLREPGPYGDWGSRDEVFARAPIAVRAGPHPPAGLRRDDQLVAVRRQIAPQDPAERLLSGPGRGTVVVRQVKMRDAEVERPTHHRARVAEAIDAAEVVPQSQRDDGKLHAALAAALVGHGIVADIRRAIRHIGRLSCIVPCAPRQAQRRERRACWAAGSESHYRTLSLGAPVRFCKLVVEIGRASCRERVYSGV